MIMQTSWQGRSVDSSHKSRVAGLGIRMGEVCDEVVAIQTGQKLGDPTIITINCPDQLGLACDLALILFEFGLTVVRGDFSKDGKWCLVLFWVTPRYGAARPIKWALLKKRLVSACPSNRAALFLPLISPAKQKKELYLLQACSADRAGLLNDVTQTLWELEIDIHKINVTTSPDGKAVNLIYVTDIRNMLQNKRRQDEVCDRVRTVLGDGCFLCELRLASPEMGGLDCVPASNLPPTVAEDLFSEGSAELESDLKSPGGHGALIPKASVNLDNSLSPGHTLLQISFRDRKGLLYDCLRTLKDLDIQVAYGRLSTTSKGTGDLDLFILQADGNKVFDPKKQKTLLSRLEMELADPIRVMVANRGPDTELLVATPMEKSGRARPRVLYDATLVLKMLDICIFKADIGRHAVGDRQWEVYRFLLAEKPGLTLTSSRTRSHIAERARNVLVG